MPYDSDLGERFARLEGRNSNRDVMSALGWASVPE
jgi:hypothetical protein